MALQRMLLDSVAMSAGEERNLLPVIDVSKYKRVHVHVSGGNYGIANMKVNVLFCTSTAFKILTASNTLWYEGAATPHDFSYTTPPSYNQTSLVLSIPVITPLLYGVTLKNLGTDAKPEMYVALFAQD